MLNSLLVKSIIKKDIESGEITGDTSKKMDKENPSGTGSFSMNRKADTEVGANSTTEGTENVASGENSHAEGKMNTSSGNSSHAEGWNSKASGAQAHAEGSSTASGKNSHSEGTATKATSEASHAEGYYTIAGGGSAHAEGNNSSASGNRSHAEGYYAHADGTSSHSEGQYTYAEGTASHSEGEYSQAQGIDSHAEGNRTTALGKTSHSEGSSTNNAKSGIKQDTSNDDVITYWESSKFSLAKGTASHVEGKDCLALGDYSHSGGLATRAGYQSQTAIGEYNDNKEENIFEVGNGTSKTARSNALELKKTGDLKIGGSYIDGSGNVLSMDSANEYTDQKIAELINGAPTTLDTLKEIADAMEENQDVVKTLDESIGKKANASDLTDHASNTNNPHNVTAEQTSYDNATSGLSAQNVQDAVDEVNDNFNNIEIGGRNLYYLKDFDLLSKASVSSFSVNDGEITVVASGADLTLGSQLNNSGDSWDKSKSPLMDIEGATQVTISISNPLFTKNFYNFLNSDKKALKSYSGFFKTSGTIPVPTGAKYLSMRVGHENSVSGTEYKLRIKIEKGNKATDWTPAIEDTEAEIDNSIIELSMLGWSVPKECPIQNEVNGNQFIQKVGRTILNGTEDWNYHAASIGVNGSFYLCFNGGQKPLQDGKGGYFTRFKTGNINDANMNAFVGADTIQLRVDDCTAPTFSEGTSKIKQWLSQNNTAVYYELATPITTTIDGNEIGETVSDVRKETTVNLLKPILGTATQDGVTCTSNGDGTYTLNGTATNGFSFELCTVNLNKFIYKTCLLIDCGKAANSSDKRTGLIAKETTTWTWVGVNDSNDYKVILDEYYYTKNVSIRIEGVKGDSYNNAIVKPMLTTNLNATYDDFVPFTGTTGKLNGDVAELEKSNEGKMGKENPTGTGAFSMNRKADTTVGDYSTTEGSNCEASAICSHAEGESTTASGSRSHAEGNATTASGYASHSEGSSTNKASSYIASDSTDDEIKTRWKSSANGFSLAKGDASHVEGTNCVALGNSAHAEGKSCIALGDNSHAGGRYSEASGDCSTAVGLEVKASRQSQTVFGKYNNNKSYTLLEVGNGDYDEARSNALELDLDGNLEIAGNFYFTDENGNKVSLRSILTRLSALEG